MRGINLNVESCNATARTHEGGAEKPEGCRYQIARHGAEQDSLAPVPVRQLADRGRDYELAESADRSSNKNEGQDAIRAARKKAGKAMAVEGTHEKADPRNPPSRTMSHFLAAVCWTESGTPVLARGASEDETSVALNERRRARMRPSRSSDDERTEYHSMIPEGPAQEDSQSGADEVQLGPRETYSGTEAGGFWEKERGRGRRSAPDEGSGRGRDEREGEQVEDECEEDEGDDTLARAGGHQGQILLEEGKIWRERRVFVSSEPSDSSRRGGVVPRAPTPIHLQLLSSHSSRTYGLEGRPRCSSAGQDCSSRRQAGATLVRPSCPPRPRLRRRLQPRPRRPVQGSQHQQGQAGAHRSQEVLDLGPTIVLWPKGVQERESGRWAVERVVDVRDLERRPQEEEGIVQGRQLGRRSRKG